MKKLNLGSGHDYREGWVNVDISKEDVYGNPVKANIYHDLNKYPYPFKEKEFEEILSYGLLEHIRNLDRHVKELGRISKTGCKLKIHVPYFLSYFSGRELYAHRFSLNCVQLFGIFRKYGFKLKSKEFNISNNLFLRLFNPVANLNNLTQNIWERFPILIPEGIDWEFVKL